MKPTVYIETTIISYLTAWRSPQLVMAANQEVTRVWWDDHRDAYDLVASQSVVDEASAGDREAAKRRRVILMNVPLLTINAECLTLAEQLVKDLSLPAKAEMDALHIAIASVHEVDYLLTWNCRHIANANLRHIIEAACITAGFVAPTICTPLELIDGDADVS